MFAKWLGEEAILESVPLRSYLCFVRLGVVSKPGHFATYNVEQTYFSHPI